MVASAPPISVQLIGERILIRPDGHLDRLTTAAMVTAVNAALSVGRTVEVAWGDDGGEQPVDAPSPLGTRADGVPATAAATADVGCLRLRTESSWWALDLGRRRLCRSDRPLDRRLPEAGAWIGVRRVWISPTTITALTAPGSFITARRS